MVGILPTRTIKKTGVRVGWAAGADGGGDGGVVVADESKAARRDRVLTQAMHELNGDNARLRRDPRVAPVVLPIRDGLTLVRRAT